MTAGGNSKPAAHQKVQRDVVVVGASAGGVEALQRLVAELPPEFPASVLVVLHMAASGTSVLPQILGRRGPLPAGFAVHGAELRRGEIYVAPPDSHMLVHDSRVRLSRGPRENGHRPAVDPLFRSAARAGGGRVVGVVLSGLLDDGASGLRFIKQSGGVTVVQSPEDAMFPGMPLAAIAVARPDRIVPLKQMAQTLCDIVEQVIDPAEADVAAIDDTPGDKGLVELEPAVTQALLNGPPSALTCPECGGALWEQDEGGLVRYVCHVGHAFSLSSLFEEQGRALETTLWSALRSLEERAKLQKRMASRSRGDIRERYEDRVRDAEQHAAALRHMLEAIGRLAVAHTELEPS